jgi:hypothetical protein
MYFFNHDVPVAFSMLRMLDHQPTVMGSPFDAFVCCWMAFSNIYTTAADRRGKGAALRFFGGAQQFKSVAHVTMTKVDTIPEADQIAEAVAMFSDDLKHRIIHHPSVGFFVRRIPRFEGNPVEFDAKGERLNGVLNVGHTVSRDYPVWSPIDPNLYAAYLGDNSDPAKRDPANREPLVQQIVQILYTVRNNTFHGGNRDDDAHEIEVVTRAIPLLRMIVDSFLIR